MTNITHYDSHSWLLSFMLLMCSCTLLFLALVTVIESNTFEFELDTVQKRNRTQLNPGMLSWEDLF